ncbi:MAG: UDP-N-acetylmuramate--L-alanine ligase, partial [Clostridia bacterium]|nr:UDP-N-acetylmuramate--L-alanine ligase [Clostridia bacterium]
MKKKRYHLIGVGGISTSAIAKHLLSRGFEVSGSDLICGAEIRELKKLGAKIYIGHDASNVIGADEVVYNSAVGEDNVELKYARDNGLPTSDRIDFLRNLSEKFGVSLGVAGCHGKTTATAMIANVLFASDYKFLAHIGGEDNNFGNYFYNGDDIFLTEVCEFNRNIRRLPAKIACVLNVGFDHADCYRDLEDLKGVYREFLNGAEFRVVNADDENLRGSKENVFTYGIGNEADFNAENIAQSAEGISFRVRYKNGEIPIKIKAFGRHNVYNALCAVAACKFLKIPDKTIAEGLGRFAGIKRRFETVGRINGARVVCDYAHHPEEIAA